MGSSYVEDTNWGSLKVRVGVLQAFKRRLHEDAQYLAELINKESGKLVAEAKMADVFPSLSIVDSLLAHQDALQPRKVRLKGLAFLGRKSWVQRVPVGTVGVITPWNYPLSIPVTGVLTALLAGNEVLLKPSELTPKTGQWLADTLAELGAPVTCMQGGGDVGRAVVEKSDGIIFTGSAATGRAIGVRCAERMIPCLLELGGKDPLVALPNADVSAVVRGAVWGAFTNAGQTCASVERMLVPREEWSMYEQEIIRQVSALQKGRDWGPMIHMDAVQRAKNHASEGTILIGGNASGTWMEPTVVLLENEQSTAWRDETFGPVLPIMLYDTVEEAIALANDNEFGLTASIWGPGAEQLAPQLQAGTITVNDCIYTFAAPDTPWTGWKQSGLGASHGAWGFDKVTKLQHINVQKAKWSPWQYPYDDLDGFIDAGLDGFHGGKPSRLRATLKRLLR